MGYETMQLFLLNIDWHNISTYKLLSHMVTHCFVRLNSHNNTGGYTSNNDVFFITLSTKYIKYKYQVLSFSIWIQNYGLKSPYAHTCKHHA